MSSQIKGTKWMRGTSNNLFNCHDAYKELKSLSCSTWYLVKLLYQLLFLSTIVLKQNGSTFENTTNQRLAREHYILIKSVISLATLFNTWINKLIIIQWYTCGCWASATLILILYINKYFLLNSLWTCSCNSLCTPSVYSSVPGTLFGCKIFQYPCSGYLYCTSKC